MNVSLKVFETKKNVTLKFIFSPTVKQKLEQKFKSIEERIIIMALESVNYSVDRASQILKIVQEEEETKIKEEEDNIISSPSEENYSERYVFII